MNGTTLIALLAVIVHVAAYPSVANAVIPPDFIFSVAVQATQIFSLLFLMVSVAFGAAMQALKLYLLDPRVRRMFMIAGIVGAVLLCVGGTYGGAKYLQQAAYDEWLAQSIEHIDAELAESAIDENDQLQIGSIDNIDTTLKAFVSNATSSTDVSTRFINDFFENIASGNIARAYEMTEKRNPLWAFTDFYKNVTKITLDKVTRIDRLKTSVELTLYRGREFTRYGALLTLSLPSTGAMFIHKSETRVLSSGTYRDEVIAVSPRQETPAATTTAAPITAPPVTTVAPVTTATPAPTLVASTSSETKVVVSIEEVPIVEEEYSFFEQHKDDPLSVSNSRFSRASKTPGDFVVIDARENIEYDNGRFPGSVHIRFADLKAGRWIEVPTDKVVYVICWSGIRGKEVAEFLRKKKIAARYLEDGASGWVEYGGKWDGNIKFAEQYTGDQYQSVLETAEVKEAVQSGVILVDSREPYKYKQSHVPGSVNIPIMYTPTLTLEETFSQVPPGSRVITICDAYVNCFDAKITGVELERRGHTFLGRYIKPWEYGQ